MFTHRKLAAIAASLALAAFGNAYAATTPAPHATHATCVALNKEVESALAGTKDARKVEAARAQRDVGEKDCKAGKYDAGAEHLRLALTDVGMKPVN